jgi:long-chain acyl-CoA synthetase
VAVLIVPYFALLEDWARANHVEFSDRRGLVSNSRVRALYEGIVDQQNRGLARFEKLKKVMLMADELTAADGTLTPSMKLRRRVVEERYRTQIDELYRQAEQEVQAHGES